MIASLGMYDWPEVTAETDAFWSALREALASVGVEAPETLTRDDDPWPIWLNPQLALSQTCGLPFAARLAGRVALIGAPDYALSDCPKGTYRSVLISRRGDVRDVEGMRGERFAYNMRESQSGWAAVDRTIPIKEHFGELVETGAHRASIVAVAEGRADCAAIDGVAWALAERHEPAAASVEVFATTAPTPGLPFITSLENADRASDLANAIMTAIAGLDGNVRDALFLRGFKRWEESDYQPLAAGWPD